MRSMLSVRIKEKRFPAVGRAEPRLVLNDLAFEVPEGQFVCLTGPSGCGKSTTLNIIAGLDADYDGDVTWSESGEGPRRVGYVFQSPRLLPWKTVLDNVRLVIPPGERDSGVAEELLHDVGMWESRHYHPTRLSLGMQRRVALARAYAISPVILLMDEPFVSLDEATSQHLQGLLLKLWQRRPTTVLFVTHDLREAIMLADRLMVFSHCPARVIEDMTIPLARDERGTSGAVEALRREIIAAHKSIFAA